MRGSAAASSAQLLCGNQLRGGRCNLLEVVDNYVLRPASAGGSAAKPKVVRIQGRPAFRAVSTSVLVSTDHDRTARVSADSCTRFSVRCSGWGLRTGKVSAPKSARNLCRIPRSSKQPSSKPFRLVGTNSKDAIHLLQVSSRQASTPSNSRVCTEKRSTIGFEQDWIELIRERYLVVRRRVAALPIPESVGSWPCRPVRRF